MKNKVEDVKDVMIDNIEKILDRGEKLDHLTQTTDDIVDQAQQFSRGTRKLKNNMWARYIILIIILIFVIVAIILVIILIVIFAVCGVNLKCGQ